MFEWPGPKFGKELSAEYDNCDVLVLPSFSENFGGVVIDALAHGKPVLASNLTPWKVLEDARCGWWVGNDPDSLAKALGTAARAPLDLMGANGRRLVSEHYTWSAVARKAIAAYQTVVFQTIRRKILAK